MTRAAAATGVPLNVLYSVGLTETGRRGELEPYDMNIDGREVRSESLAEAMARFAAAKAQGAKLIDIGCMQINAHWHAAHFASLGAMFDPGAQRRLCGELLEEPSRPRQAPGRWRSPATTPAPTTRRRERTYVCAVIRNMVASGFGKWTANARALCQ